MSTPEKALKSGSREGPKFAGRIGSCVESFEECFLKRAFFLGENKLDRVLLSLLRQIDECSQEEFEGQTYLINRRSFKMKVNKTSNKIRFEREMTRDKKFSLVQFAVRFGIPLDTINGIFPLRFSNPRLVFHSLKLSYALYLTMKMFKISDLKTNQRHRGGRIFLEKENLLSTIFVNVYSEFKILNLEESKLIKCMKNSLCFLVSSTMEQTELPEGDRIDLFPGPLWSQIKASLSPDDLVRFAFSCLQSKVLCQEVPEEFVLDALIKHQNQLSSEHKGVSATALEQCRERGRAFGKLVKKYYKPEEGYFPTNKATFGFPRNKGGVKGDLVYHNRLEDFTLCEDPEDRMEPFVVGLFGQPGMGKSTSLNRIISTLAPLFPKIPSDSLVYQRTCHVDHWDGYRGQPIVIFDDLGQTSDGHDIQEFQTLVSCCPYVLPMADLAEKGQKFCSSVIICTSNLVYGSPLREVYSDNNPIIDDASFWRRFHVPLYVEFTELYGLKKDPSWIRENNLIVKRRSSVANNAPKNFNHSRFFMNKSDFAADGNQDKWQPFTDFNSLRQEYLDRKDFHNNFRATWKQVVVDDYQDTSSLDPLLREIEQYDFTSSFDYSAGEYSRKGLSFPSMPPPGPLPVRVEPIREPLKVRTITAGIGDTFCLKPLQRAMWFAMGEEEQFCLTHGTNRLESAIQRIYEESDPDDVWISGDYSAATDSFAIEASKALLLGILESIDHEPTRRWAMKEISPHLLVYPKSSGLSPVLQKSGQLMGSLLSFPLLCLLNDCTARHSGLSPKKYLINGDDILMRAPVGLYTTWKDKVNDFGLSLSLGKNYVHSRFGTVNSQLILDGKVLGSGKQMVLDRRTRVLGECLRDLELHMSETPSQEVQDLFKSVNRQKLSKTVRNISVPVSHGGLSFGWGKPLSDKKSVRTAQLCYLHDLFRHIKPSTKSVISIPYLSNEKKCTSDLQQLDRTFNEPVNASEYHEDFVGPQNIQAVHQRCMNHPVLREILLDKPLDSLPSLSFIKTIEVPCTDSEVRKDLQKQIDSVFLRNFLQGGQEWGYEVFREEVIRNSKRMEKTATKTTEYIVSLMDLEIPPDFLQYVNLGYQPQSYEAKEFIQMISQGETLNKTFKPKNFDLPENFPDYDDFSEEIVLQQVISTICNHWENLRA